jgi:flagellar motor switch/type III secretory pathway protein FliN
MPEETEESEAGGLAIPVLFIGVEDVPILFVNQFVISFQQEEFILSAGQLAPPILIGSEEEKREQAKQLSYVPIKVVARLGMTAARLSELVSLLQNQLRKYDERRGASEDAERDIHN